MTAGVPVETILFWLSALFFTIASLWMIKPLKNSRGDKLIVSLTSFLTGMALFHIFWGIAILYDHNHLINFWMVHIGAFFALIGSALTLRILLYFLIPKWEKVIYYLVLLSGVAFEIWMILMKHSQMIMDQFIFTYMIIFAGSTGIFLMIYALKLPDFSLRFKSFGAGLGIVSCCFVADIIVLTDTNPVLAESLMALSPIIIIATLLYGRHLQKKNSHINSFKNHV